MSHIGILEQHRRDLLRVDASADQAHRRARGAQLVDQPSGADRSALGRGHVLAVGRGLGAVSPRVSRTIPDRPARHPSAQTTTTTIAPSTAHNGLGDCLMCALDVLSQSGFVRTATGWTTASATPLDLTHGRRTERPGRDGRRVDRARVGVDRHQGERRERAQ